MTKDHKQRAARAVTLARIASQLMDEICRLSEHDPEIAALICEQYPFAKALDEVSCDVIAWRDAMAAKAGVPLNPDGLRGVFGAWSALDALVNDAPLRIA
jgi:hypothetical protein